MADEHLAVEAHKGRKVHVETYWLTTVEGDLALSECEPQPWSWGDWYVGPGWYAYTDDLPQGVVDMLYPLADPDYPVKVRLQVTAERIEEEA